MEDFFGEHRLRTIHPIRRDEDEVPGPARFYGLLERPELVGVFATGQMLPRSARDCRHAVASLRGMGVHSAILPARKSMSSVMRSMSRSTSPIRWSSTLSYPG